MDGCSSRTQPPFLVSVFPAEILDKDPKQSTGLRFHQILIPSAEYQVAICYHNLKEWDEAETYYHKAVAHFKESPFLTFFLPHYLLFFFFTHTHIWEFLLCLLQ